MKRKLFSIFFAISLLISSSLALFSCSISGSSGISDAQINENGELIIVYQDGTTQNLGVVVGKDGSDGKDGKDGQDGKDGMDGKDGTNTSGDSVIISKEENNITLASAIGLRSAVSITCNFKATVQQGGWRPGSGSTTIKEYSSAGSGVIYKLDKSEGDAFIITNYHVVYDSSSNTENGISDDISVYLYGSETNEKAIKAVYVGGSLYYDVAVLHVDNSEIIKNSDASAVAVTNSDQITVGNDAIAIGNAQGLGISTSVGIVSVDSEYITMTAADGKSEVSFRVMRVDTAINSGNSGGGLYDGQGRLIGIVNAKIVDDGVENIGYAIPSNVAVSIAENIIDYCYGTSTESVQRALLGITVTASDSKAVYNEENGTIRIEETVSVYEVNEGSLSYGVLESGDIFVSATLAGKTIEITRQYHIIDIMLDVRVGDTISITVIRNGEQITLSLTITEDCLSSY